jgi:hypothetical protein
MDKVIINPNSIIGEDTGVSGKARWLLWCHDSIKDVPQREIRSFCNNYPVVRGADTWGTEGFKEGVSQNATQHKLYLYLEKYSTRSETNRELLKQELTQNPLEIIYELASPYYELIDEYNNTILNVPKNVAHLTHTSAVPVNNTTFTNYKDELNVLESNTQYRVMFDCDKPCSSLNLTLGGTTVPCTSTAISGTKSFLITTPSTLVDKNLVIDGIGRCGIDNIRIFKGDVEYDYVKGLWSGYEERKLAIVYNKEIQKVSCANLKYHAAWLDIGYLKPYTKYTCIITIETILKDTLNNYKPSIEFRKGGNSALITSNKSDLNVFCVTTQEYFLYRFKLVVTGGRYPSSADVNFKNILVLEGDWTDNPPTYEEVMGNEGKYAVKVKLDTNATIFGKGGRL